MKNLINPIQALAIDLDGTILNDRHEITDYTCEILKKASHKYRIIITTGRMYKSAARFHTLLSLTTPVICYNGAMVVHKNHIISHVPLQKNSATAILSSELFPARLLAFSDDSLFVTGFDQFVDEYCQRAGVEYIILPAEKILELSLTKIILSGNPDDLKKLSTAPCFQSSELYTAFSKPNYFECMNSAVSKSTVYPILNDIYGINSSAVAAFGDSYNDMELFDSAGVKIAVNNAVECLKNSADCICDSNNKDGVARFIEQNLLAEH